MIDPDEYAEMRAIDSRMKAAERRRARERWDGDPWFDNEPPDPPEEIQALFDRAEHLRLLALQAFMDNDVEVGDALLERASNLDYDANRELSWFLQPF